MTLVATVPSLAWIAVALVLAGLLQSGVQLARNLSLRAALPSRAHAAGYSVLYAATGVGYAGSAILAGAVQRAASPEDAILAGAGLTLLLTAVSALAELTPRRRTPIRRAAKAVMTRDCASESQLVPGCRARTASAATAVWPPHPAPWDLRCSRYSRASRVSPPAPAFESVTRSA